MVSTQAASHLAVSLLLLLVAACSPPAGRPGWWRSPEGCSPTPPPVKRQEPRAGTSRLSSSLLRELDGSPSGRFVEVLADLVEQVDFDALRLRFQSARLDRAGRRGNTISALERVAERRKQLEVWLEGERATGRVDVWRGYAIVNRLYVSATPALILELGRRPEVATVFPVREDPASAKEPAPPPRGGPTPPRRLIDLRVGPSPETSWALDAIGARQAWSSGWDGRGVVVGSLDSGVAGQHVALRGNHRPDSGWFDPLRGSLEPFDDHGHGTETMGCAVGLGVHPGEVGVARGAIWIAARANPLNVYNSYGMTASADWMLRSGRADVLLCAWGHGPGRCDTRDLPILRALRLAEVPVALPAGNSGPAAGTAESPASLPPLFPGDLPPLAVAAVTLEGKVLEQSARGPSPCSPSTQFPWVAAPGAGLRVPLASSPDGYDSADGTSLAAGYVAGTVAVLLQRCPGLDVDQVQTALASTATDIGEKGPDPASGYGLINLPAALDWAGRHCR